MKYRRQLHKLIAVWTLLIVAFSSLQLPANAAFENTYVLTGDGVLDIIGVAATQIGYTEGADGYSKYGDFLGRSTMDWCAAFIVWCANEAGISTEIIPADPSSTGLKNYFEARGEYSGAKNGTTVPLPGDIAFFSATSSAYNITHVGLVVAVDEDTIYMIEGNYSDTVAETSYQLGNSKIIGFASPDYGSNFTGYKTGRYVTGYALNLRTSYDENAQWILTMPMDTNIYISEIHGSWGKTTYNGRTGWCHLGYCTYLPESYKDIKWLVADISKWNSSRQINWDAFKANGVEAVILRVGGRGYGAGRTLYEDDAFATHYNGAKAAGLHVGVYFFSYALNNAEAKEEAEMTLRILRENNFELDMPVFIDIEDYAEGRINDYQHYRAGKKVCTDVVNTFCDVIKAAGFYPGIYCNKSFAETLIEPSAFENRAVWIAQYGVSQCGYGGDYDMWQYTPYGRLSAYNGYIDLSYCYTDFPALIAEEGDFDSFGEHKAADEWTVITAASCVSEGSREKKCVDCGITLISETVNRTEHKASDKLIRLLDTDLTVGTQLTNSEIARLYAYAEDTYLAFRQSGGTLLTYCTNCKKILSAEYSFPEEHSGDAHKLKETVTAASCTGDGVREQVCSTCQKTIEATLLPATAHATGKTELTKTTCTEEGSKITYCLYCEAEIRREYSAPSDHRYGNTVTVTPASFTSEGRAVKTCYVCGDTQSIALPMILLGDFDLDGSVTSEDARLTLRASVGLETPDADTVLRADVDNSGKIESSDARLVLRLAVGLEDAAALIEQYHS